jgi:hypothetical protein
MAADSSPTGELTELDENGKPIPIDPKAKKKGVFNRFKSLSSKMSGNL